MKHTKALNAHEILELIFRHLTEVTTFKEYDDILKVLAEMGRGLSSAERCTVWVVSDDKKKLWTKVAHGMHSIEIPVSSGIVGSAVSNREKIIIDDVYDDPRFNSDVDKATGYRTKSMMVIPMFDKSDEIIGAFQVMNHQDEESVFDKRDMERLMLASTYAAETLEAAKLAKEITDTQKEVVFTMGSIAESRSKETGNHVKRVAEYSKILALAYGMSGEDAELLKQASPMHDIGKVAIPDSILNKPGRFNDEERKIMDTHAERGYNMIKNSQRPLLKAAAIVAYQHHEKWNGKGYPNQLAGEEIHIYGRITALADVFDALGSDRVYKKAWNDEKIFKMFKEERAEQFDPKLIDLFFENLQEILAVRDAFKDQFKEEKESEPIKDHRSIQILGAFGTKSKGHGTSSFYLNEKNVIDAGNLLYGLEEKSVSIDHIWLTHSHLDHICDIAYILDNYYASIVSPIIIRGLPQTIQAVQKHYLNDLIWPDFSKIPLCNSKGMCIEYEEIKLDNIYSIGENETIQAFKTDHTVPSCGYVYTYDGAAVLITADTYSLEKAIEIIDTNLEIKSIVVECSFPSHMDALAKASKHLTPKLLFDALKELKREDVNLYINHIKPLYLEEITDEINEFSKKWTPKILKDGDFVNF